jgi:hypothetical protein
MQCERCNSEFLDDEDVYQPGRGGGAVGPTGRNVSLSETQFRHMQTAVFHRTESGCIAALAKRLSILEKTP